MVNQIVSASMTKADLYRERLGVLAHWDAYLLEQSGLPGPRGNLELAQVVADLGDEQLFRRYLACTPDAAPTNSPYEFLAFCGVVGLGRLLAEGDRRDLSELRRHASDPRWRLREAVAMALQRWGDADMQALLAEMQAWVHGSPLEQRAAAAGLCEPRLLVQPAHTRAVLSILESITAAFEKAPLPRSAEFTVLRKGLGYCWSVAVVALPGEGKPLLEKWLACTDKDIRWIMGENLKKARLERMDSIWVMAMRREHGY